MRDKVKVITYDINEEGSGVFAISLVENPAIGVNFIALNDHKKNYVKFEEQESKRRMLYGALLIPDQFIFRVHPKTNEEYYVKFTKETIRKIAYNYIMNNRQHNATYEHESKIDGVSLVETWLIEGDYDKSMNFGFSLPVGTWFGGMYVSNDDIWAKVEENDVFGFSIEGEFDALEEQYLSTQTKLMLEEIETLIKEHSSSL